MGYQEPLASSDELADRFDLRERRRARTGRELLSVVGTGFGYRIVIIIGPSVWNLATSICVNAKGKFLTIK